MDPTGKEQGEVPLVFLRQTAVLRATLRHPGSGRHRGAALMSPFLNLPRCWDKSRPSKEGGALRQQTWTGTASGPPAPSAGKRLPGGRRLSLGAPYHPAGCTASTPGPVWPAAASPPPGSTAPQPSGRVRPLPRIVLSSSCLWGQGE